MNQLFALMAAGVLATSSSALAQDTITLPPLADKSDFDSAFEAFWEPSRAITADATELPSPIGRGYYSLAGDLRGECVTGTLNPNPPQSFSTDYDLFLIKSSDDFRKVSNLSAAGAFGFGIWKGEASSQYYRSATQSRNADYLFVRVLVEGPTYEISRPKIIPGSEADRAAKAGRWSDFRRLCGNFFAASVKVGGEFSAIFSFESRSEEDRAALQAQLKIVARGYGSGEAAFSEALERVSRNSALKVKIIRKGTNETLPEDNIPDLIAYAKTFSTKINAQNARPIESIRRDYQTINPKVPVYSSQEAIIEKWARYLGEANSSLADIEYAKGALDTLYPPTSVNALDAMSKSLQSYVENLERAARSCAEDPTVCEALSGTISEASYAVPKRAQRKLVYPSEVTEQLLGVVGPDETRKVVLLGQWSAWDNGPEWWAPERCCVSIVVQKENGQRIDSSYNPGSHTVTGPARVFVRFGDSTWTDNRGSIDCPKRPNPPYTGQGCLQGVVY